MAKQEKLRVLVVRPNEQPVIEMIDNSLDGLQSVIGGGYVQAQHNFAGIRGLDLMMDEDGIQKELAPNRPVMPGAEPILGTFYFVRHNKDGQHEGVTDEDVGLLMPRLA